ncbi:MAG: HEAT repeat domain-containing protein [Vicinamibacterales bacterium]
MMRRALPWTVRFPLLVALLTTAACASNPPAPPVPVEPPAPQVPLDEKVAWILRLEQQRVLADRGATAMAPEGAARMLTPAGSAHLGALSLDPDAAVRRRAALAIGRVGDPAGARWLVGALSDTEPDVRASAAFALGLLAAPDTAAPLEAALADPDPMVRGRAAEALGLIGPPAAGAGGAAGGASGAGPAIATAAAGCGPWLASVTPEDEAPQDPNIEVCRLSLFALVRLRDYDSLAKVALGPDGAPVTRWWPVAFALQRIGDRRAADALWTLAPTPGVMTASFAIRGLAALGDARVAPLAVALVGQADADVRLRVTAARALAQLKHQPAVPGLEQIAFGGDAPPNLALEAVGALGAIGDGQAFDALIDRFVDPWPAMRLAAMRAAARLDPQSFLFVLSSLPADPEPTVRAGLAEILGTLPAESARPALEALAADQDPRVQAPVLTALAAVGAPDLMTRVDAALGAADYGLRAAAASILGDRKPEGGIARLATAYDRAGTDATDDARVAALEGLAAYGGEVARGVLTRALDDPSWPVRLVAARLLRAAGVTDARPTRPATLREPADVFGSEAILHPAYSPHAFIDLPAGVIEIELNVVEAPMTTRSFVELARAGFFNGLAVHRVVPAFVVQAGDPRGDGSGGPGYTIQDELSAKPFVRGTVGMALSGPDTGGSQFFITVSPQPHLDARYTVFGTVVQGMEHLDAIRQGDVIQRIRIWDGVTFR